MISRGLSDPQQMKKLVRVIQTRVQRAEIALQTSLSKLREIEREVEQRQAKVTVLENDVAQVMQFLGSEPSQAHLAIKPDEYQLALQRRYWSDYDRQKEQYYLDITHDEHKEQHKVVADARSTYVGLKSKLDLMQENLRSCERTKENKRQARQDAEQTGSGINVNQTMGMSS